MVASDDRQPQSTLGVEETLEKAPEESKLVEDEKKVGEEDEAGKEEPAGRSSSNVKVGDSEDKQEQDPKKSLALADEFFEKGCKAIEENNLIDAVDFCSRALEIRVLHYGELAPECASAYYKYGCALLFKAQDEADPLGDVVPKGSQKDSTTSKTTQGSGTSKISREEGPSEITSEEGDGGIDDEDVDNMGEGDEDDSDLDMAWNMLDIARSIDEKHCKATLDTVKILSALGDVSLEREDFDTCLSDYNKALSIIGNLEVPDHRRAIDLNFRICLALEVAVRIEESIPFCEKAIALSKSCLQRLKDEIVKIKDSSSAVEDAASSSGSQLSEKEEEVEVVSSFQSELEKKLEDLQQALFNPKPLLSEDQKNLQPGEKVSTKVEARLMSSNSSRDGKSHSSFDSPTISATATNGNVTHLGVVGRGVKRATISPIATEPAPKRIAVDGSGEEAVTTKKAETPK